MAFTGQKIKTMYARQLAKNFKDFKLGKQLLTDDTRAVWFSSKVVLEALNLPRDTPVGNVSGLRIYLGAYENREDYPENPDFRRMLTLVMVQTEEVLDANGNFLYHKDVLDDPDDMPNYPPPGAVFNDGQICPPPKCDPRGLLKFE